MNRRIAIVAAVLGLTGVMLGAFGAHGLKGVVESLPDGAARLAWWETGARYHLVHALAVAACAILAAHVPGRAPRFAAWALLLGVVVFSGSLYVMALTGVRALGRITPVGGVSLLAGWAAFWLAALKLPGGRSQDGATSA